MGKSTQVGKTAWGCPVCGAINPDTEVNTCYQCTHAIPDTMYLARHAHSTRKLWLATVENRKLPSGYFVVYNPEQRLPADSLFYTLHAWRAVPDEALIGTTYLIYRAMGYTDMVAVPRSQELSRVRVGFLPMQEAGGLEAMARMPLTDHLTDLEVRLLQHIGDLQRRVKRLEDSY